MPRRDDRKGAARSFLDAHREGPTQEVWGIGELARELGTTTRAIRFYESKGLLQPRRVGSVRVYGRRERARLQLVLRGRSVGISLREMAQYLDLYGERGEGRERQLEHVVDRTGALIAELEERRKKIDETLEELKLIRRESARQLRRLRRAPSHE